MGTATRCTASAQVPMVPCLLPPASPPLLHTPPSLCGEWEYMRVRVCVWEWVCVWVGVAVYVRERKSILSFNQIFVYQSICSWQKSCGLCPRSVRTKKAIRAVRKRDRRNHVRKQKILSRSVKIVPRTISCILKYDLRLAACETRMRWAFLN